MGVLEACLRCECLGLILAPELLLKFVTAEALEPIVEGCALEPAGHYKLSVY